MPKLIFLLIVLVFAQLLFAIHTLATKASQINLSKYDARVGMFFKLMATSLTRQARFQNGPSCRMKGDQKNRQQNSKEES